MEYIQSNLPKQSEKYYTCFNKIGKPVVNPKENVYAKILNSKQGQTYYVQTYQNKILDPSMFVFNREKFAETSYKKVNKETFDFYLIYLQTNNSIYLTRANRSFLNE